MSFHNKNFWLHRESVCLTDGMMNAETSSKVEQKRTHQWDIPVREFFSNKRQAVESIASGPIQAENVDISLWNNPSSCQSVSAFSDHLFVPESIGTCDLSDKTISSKDSGNLNAERAGGIDQFGNSSAINLAMTHDIEQSFCGMGKSNVNQVRDSGNGFSLAMMQPLTAGENDIFTRCIAYQRNDNHVTPQPTYQKENVDVISPVTTFSKEEVNIITMGQTLAKGNDDSMLISHPCSRETNPMLPAGLPYNRWNCNLIQIDQQYGKETSSFMSTGPAYDKEHENIFMISHTYDKGAEMSTSTTFDKRDDVIATVVPTPNKEDSTAVSKGITYGNQKNVLSIGQNYDEGEATTISFGAEASDLSVRLLSSSDVPIGHSSGKPAETHAQNGFMEQNVNQVGNVASASNKVDGALKSKEQKKKIPTNNFPSNVKSMLSTGIFDGVPVKYVSWSREKSLQGVIKGTGYLCGCKDCNHSKALNAYEFERHAGGKTKHPNNHIFFENGKSVYAAVQELKSTSQEMLFEAIEKVTGSSINQKNFRIWKVSYQAATRELERIYGKDEAVKRA